MQQKLWLESYAQGFFRKYSAKAKKPSLVSRLRSKSLSSMSKPSANEPKKPSDGATFDMEERLTYSKQTIAESLCDLGEDMELNEKTVELFCQIQRVMGDLSSPKVWNVIAQEVIAVILAKKNLIDEFFCQVAKQVTRNSNPEGVLQTLALISVAAGCFVPSPQLYGPFEDLLTHLPMDCTLFWQQNGSKKKAKTSKSKHGNDQQMQEYQNDIQLWVATIRRRFEATWRAVGEREMAPSLLEINAIRVCLLILLSAN